MSALKCFGKDGRKMVVNIDPDRVGRCVLIDCVVLHN